MPVLKPEEKLKHEGSNKKQLGNVDVVDRQDAGKWQRNFTKKFGLHVFKHPKSVTVYLFCNRRYKQAGKLARYVEAYVFGCSAYRSWNWPPICLDSRASNHGAQHFKANNIENSCASDTRIR